MYFPVADDTMGGTPMLIRMGLKIEPPPTPSAPATQPARNETPNSLMTV